jgi:hypothetical protein
MKTLFISAVLFLFVDLLIAGSLPSSWNTRLLHWTSKLFREKQNDLNRFKENLPLKDKETKEIASGIAVDLGKTDISATASYFALSLLMRTPNKQVESLLRNVDNLHPAFRDNESKPVSPSLPSSSLSSYLLPNMSLNTYEFDLVSSSLQLPVNIKGSDWNQLGGLASVKNSLYYTGLTIINLRSNKTISSKVSTAESVDDRSDTVTFSSNVSPLLSPVHSILLYGPPGNGE